MKSKRRLLLTTTALVLLTAMLAYGCGSESGTSQSISTSEATSSPAPNAVEMLDGKEIKQVVLPANVVAMVDGKEITKADLEAGMIADNNYDLAHIGETDVDTGEIITGNLLQPGTPEYARRASIVVGRLVLDEIARTEAQKMGLTVTEADIDTYYENAKAGNGDNLALNRDQVRKLLLVDAVWQEVTKDVPLDADGVSETAKQEAYTNWMWGMRSKRVITYGNQYLPSTREIPADTTATATQ